MKQTKTKGKVCSSSKEECNSEMDIMLKCKYNYADSFYTQQLPSIGQTEVVC